MTKIPQGRLFATIREQPWYDCLGLLIGVDTKTPGRVSVGELRFKDVEQGSLLDPTLVVTGLARRSGEDPFQGLFQDLWNLGYRAKGATQQDREELRMHLRDMRRLVFSHWLKGGEKWEG